MSGSIRVSLGSPLPLTLQTYDANAGVYPQARVYDSTFTEIGASPLNLTHVAGGLYKNLAFTPPAQGVYYAVYTVYSDSGHTTVLNRYARVTDEFDVNTLLVDAADNDDDDARTA